MRHLLGFLRGFWHGLDVLRRVLHLVLLLLLLVLVVLAMHESRPGLPAKGALVIHPSGDLVEQLSGDPFERALNRAQGQSAPQTLLWDLTRAIRAAATDDRVQALLIDTDDLTSAGQPQVEELAAAIAQFRRSGKKVIARGGYYTQDQYLLAAQADEVYLDPLGFVLLTGYERYRMYFREALDKLSVDVHLIRAGKFKSAEEPFIRKDMSAEDREASGVYLRALWKGLRESLAAARHLEPGQLETYVEGYGAAVVAAGGDTAAVAQQAGLVTALKSGAEVDRMLADLVGKGEQGHGFSAIDSDDYVKTLRSDERLHRASGNAVGVVIASGEMLDGHQPSGTIGGESTAALLRRAREDDNVRAVVLRIDSPGGSVYAAEQIYREVLALREAGKPVVASMGDVAASGGYYIAAPADEIYASANTITGSIGVFGVLPTFDRSLARLGVHVDGLGTTPLSGALRLDRPLKSELEQLLQSVVNHTYQGFLERVATGRHKTVAAIDEIAQGRVWAGSDALRLGLVDHIGGYQDALDSAAQRAHLGKHFETRVIEPELGFAEQLMLSMRSGTMRLARAFLPGVPGGSQAAVPATLARDAASLAPQLTAVAHEVQRWQRLAAARDRVVAYCPCDLR
jgi:protease-4